MRDIDAGQKGHNPKFLDRVTANVLKTLTEIPQYKGNILLGRPTNHSITLSLLSREDAKVKVATCSPTPDICKSMWPRKN